MFHDFLDFLYPRICNACERALLRKEQVICTQCLHELPITDYHLEKENPVKKIFYGRLPVENATSLLLFEKKGMVRELIHNLKYRGNEEIGSYLGKWMGEELKNTPPYSSVTSVVPVPLHKSKLRKRGFNQVEKFGREIAEALRVPYVDHVLVKRTASRTQTRKKRFARWGSMEETFLIDHPEKLHNHHILLVDDLVTTGATLEACATRLQTLPGVRISIATMAYAH